MNATTAADLIATAKTNNEDLMVTLTDGTVATGAPISVNSKGVNLKIDGKTRSFGLARIASLDLVTDDDTDSVTELEEIYAMLEDGMTTTDLAAALSDHLNIALTPKELRVHLRALGLGVGKGRKYSLSASEFRSVRSLIVAN